MSRRAVVTGAAGGIGSAISRRLAADGFEVVTTDLQGADRVLDITDHVAAAALADELGAVDVLVNNAGWDRVMPFLDTDAELWERVIRINLLGPIGVTHAFARGMKERGAGRIVNIASDAGRVGSSGEVVYSAAKGGVIAFTKGLARELARYSINVNCVCPGPTDTPMLSIFEGERGRQIIESMTKAVPFRRLAQPNEIAAAVAFLASDDAAYITGQTLSVSGGLTMA
jgi:2-hydroxycyclohexanecarboxyl-CoA dehydrogenase